MTYDKRKKSDLVNDEEMTITANLNNLEPGESVEVHREIEQGNIFMAAEEIKQQNENL